MNADRITAKLYIGPDLHAPVEIISDPNTNEHVHVRTLPGGAGGWSTPGKDLYVPACMLRDRSDRPAEPEPVTEPVPPLTEVIDGDTYLEVLERRMEAWKKAHPRVLLPPLLEWFIKDEDQPWVDLTRPRRHAQQDQA